MEHEEYKQMLELEALGLLEGAEAQALRGHLLTCDECRAELGKLCDAVTLLVHLTPPATPSPDVRERILANAASRTQRAHAEKTREAESAEVAEQLKHPLKSVRDK